MSLEIDQGAAKFDFWTYKNAPARLVKSLLLTVYSNHLQPRYSHDLPLIPIVVQ